MVQSISCPSEERAVKRLHGANFDESFGILEAEIAVVIECLLGIGFDHVTTRIENVDHGIMLARVRRVKKSAGNGPISSGTNR
jgi:hypothetical protein